MLCRRHGFLLSVWRLGHSKCYIYVLNIWGMLQADQLGMIYCWLYMWLPLSIMIIETIYISEWTLCWNCYIFFMASINPDFIWLFSVIWSLFCLPLAFSLYICIMLIPVSFGREVITCSRLHNASEFFILRAVTYNYMNISIYTQQTVQVLTIINRIILNFEIKWCKIFNIL